MRVRALPFLGVILLATTLFGQETRPLTVDDIFNFKNVGDPRISPDGEWIAYTVSQMNAEKDNSDTDIYMVSIDGQDTLHLTTSEKGESSPRWSPDGKYLAFLSGREGDQTQVWLLDRRGGEASRLTDFKSGVSSFTWSPDSTRLALVMRDEDPKDEGESRDREDSGAPDPIVINRLQFKRDGQGYLNELRRHVYVFDIESEESTQITDGPYDDSAPVWSPDSRWLAFASNRTEEPDSNANNDVFVVRAVPGQMPRKLTTSPGSDSSPAFSPDGKSIVYVAGGAPEDIWYSVSHLAIVPVDGGTPRELTAQLDRNGRSPRFDASGDWVYFVLEDGGNNHLTRVPASGGEIDRVFSDEASIRLFDIGPNGELVVLESQPHQPYEVSLVRDGAFTRVTHVNDEFLAGIRLGSVERIQGRSADGTIIDAFLTRPPDSDPGEPLPTLLRIHGGPVSQYTTAFNTEWQILAAEGYNVVAANPRGSSGYGRDFSYAIWADWGNKDFEDVMAAVSRAVEMGAADPDRLGVGGWSYGGILTNYVITQTDRFKVAISGASEVNYLSNYGTDHYQRQWEAELGLPWENTDLWMEISPFFNVDKIVTPTLLMGGEDDVNVPTLNSEQMYQALRRLGRETELVVYPGQNHGIRRPSYQVDRYNRYIAWYDRFLRPERAPATDEQGRTPETTSLLGVPLFAPVLDVERKKTYEENLGDAAAEFVLAPDEEEKIIWVGRRMAYLGRYQDAVAVYSRGIDKIPDSYKLLRHRGHRYITLRQFDDAIADLERATTLIEGVTDQIEPDGLPNAQNTPVSTSHFNIWYHLGLARYLKGDFDGARGAFEECLKFSVGSNDRIVAASDGLYLSLKRLGRDEDAMDILEPIHADMEVIENTVYLNRLLFYKGEKDSEQLRGQAGEDVARATYGYAVASRYLHENQSERATEALREVIQGSQWAAFGFIAAEADLARMEQESGGRR